MTAKGRAAVAVGAVAACCLVAPAGAGAATTFGADMTMTPSFTSSIYSITNVIKPDGTPDTGSPVSGVLTSVRIKTTGAGGTGAIRVLRQTSQPFPNTYGLLNTAPEISVTVTADATVPGHITEVLTRRPIEAGDRLGWTVNEMSGSIYEQAPAPDLGAGVVGDCAFSPGTHTLGTSQNYDRAGCNNLLVLVSGTVEPDADGDGFGDESQDLCPTNGALQTACPAAPAPQPKKKKCKKPKKKRSPAAKKKCKKKKR